MGAAVRYNGRSPNRKTTLQHVRHEIVSDASEQLILVDSNDNQVGVMDKQSCHNGEGVLHRAFSLFVFNPAGELLLQQRAAGKRLWPKFWSNSCCSHPRQGEQMPIAVERRCREELGFTLVPRFVYKFEYHASYLQAGSEHELCSVFSGHFDGQPHINSSEIQAWRWCPVDELNGLLESRAENFTPWFKLEWQRLSTEFAHVLPTK